MYLNCIHGCLIREVVLCQSIRGLSEGLLCYGMSSASAKAGWTDGDIQQSEFLVTSTVINRTVRYLISLINPDESWLVFDDKLERDDSNTDPRSCPRRQQQFISWIARNLTSIDRILI
jgi:hypothetical protein